MPTHLRTKIFESFYTNRLYGKASTGMGLPYVRRVAEAHGGSADVESMGPGATFVLRISQFDRQPS